MSSCEPAVSGTAAWPPHRGLCALCGRWASDAVVLAEVHGDAGPGWTQYAHEDCARERGLRPVDAR